MFTLSQKFRILNTPSEVSVVTDANVAVATALAVVNTDVLKVAGYGRFDVAKISNIKCRRAIAASADSKDFTAVAPAGLTVGDAIEVLVSLKTSRYQSEVLTANSIGGGRTMKFCTAPLTAVTPTAIAAAIVAGFEAWKALFTVGNALVTVVAGAGATDVTVSGDAAGSISISRVEIKRVNQGIGSQTPVSLAVSVVNSIAFEGQGQGKFLEESIRMSTPMNTDPYAVDTASTGVDIRGAYTEITFDYATSFEENLATNGADYGNTSIGGPAMGGVPASHTFTMFLNEATCLAGDSAIELIAAIAVLRAGVYAYLTATVAAAPLTAAQERSEVLIFTDNSSVATSATFIA
jgi:hypothetical protein